VGTALEGLRKPTELIVIVITLLSYGCPLQAIVHAFDLDERTVASWRDRGGKQCERVHQAIIELSNKQYSRVVSLCSHETKHEDHKEVTVK
jgi:hypothetical protein